MEHSPRRIALGSPGFPDSLEEGLSKLEKMMAEASRLQAEIICLPESFIPGYPVEGYTVKKASPQELESARDRACALAAKYQITLILPMDWYSQKGLLNIAFVISPTGAILGYQTKNQLDPSEDQIWVAGDKRELFEVNGLKFGITICHEGFRYPESVRWSAVRGAAIVFHPHCTSSNLSGSSLQHWGDRDNPYYEKAAMMRALENTIYFASVNYAARFQDSATSMVDPQGKCLAYQPYGKEGILVAEIDPGQATGLLAHRFNAKLYR